MIEEIYDPVVQLRRHVKEGAIVHFYISGWASSDLIGTERLCRFFLFGHEKPLNITKWMGNVLKNTENDKNLWRYNQETEDFSLRDELGLYYELAIGLIDDLSEKLFGERYKLKYEQFKP